MLRSRRATPIQDIVDGATTEDRTDCRQKHRLCISTSEHLDSKGCGERHRKLRAVVCRSASVQQESRIRRLLGLDALDDLGPFALELAGILNRGGLGGAGGSNLGGSVGLELRCRRSGRCGSRSDGGLGHRSRGRLKRSRGRLGGRRGRRLGRRSGSAAVPGHAALARGRSSGGDGRRRSGSTGARNERRLLSSSGRGCSRRTRLSSSHARRHGAVGDHGLQACHALGQGFNRQIGLGTRQTRTGDLEHQAHVARAPHLQRGIVEHRQHAGQTVGRMLAKGSSLDSKRLGLLGPALKQLGTGAGNAGHIHVAHMRHQVARQLKQIIALLDLCANEPIEFSNITLGNSAGKLAQDLVRNLAQKRAGIVRMHGAVAKNAQLLQRGKRVAHAALGMARHDGERLVVVIEALLLAHVGQAMLDILVADTVEIEALAAREDGLQNLLRVGGAQHKDHVRRRLLERLEQRVERRRREHVDLVDDIDLVLATHRGKVDGVDNLLAHIVHARAACGIELVDIGVVALGDELALLAGAVGHATARTLGARRLGVAAQ